MTRDGKLLVHSLVVCIWLGTGTGAGADRAPDLTPTQQAIQADLIIVGKVDSMESDLVQASPYQGAAKVAHQVGLIKISDGLLGAKGLTQARVGFIPRPAEQNPMKYPYRGLNHSLTVGQEAVFFLKKHPEADLYVQLPLGPALNKNNANYEKELDGVKKIASTLNDPVKALKAADAGERQRAACTLCMHYRAAPLATGKAQIKTEPIPAEESKMILQTLAEMEWGHSGADGVSNLNNVFLMMNLTAAEGWTPPKLKPTDDANKIIGDAARKWLKDHAETYRIQRLVLARAK